MGKLRYYWNKFFGFSERRMFSTLRKLDIELSKYPERWEMVQANLEYYESKINEHIHKVTNKEDMNKMVESVKLGIQSAKKRLKKKK